MAEELQDNKPAAQISKALRLEKRVFFSRRAAHTRRNEMDAYQTCSEQRALVSRARKGRGAEPRRKKRGPHTGPCFGGRSIFLRRTRSHIMAPILGEKIKKMNHLLSYRMDHFCLLMCLALSLFASNNEVRFCAGLVICLHVFGMCSFHFLLSLLVVPASREEPGLSKGLFEDDSW